jgi:hypothetical protein
MHKNSIVPLLAISALLFAALACNAVSRTTTTETFPATSAPANSVTIATFTESPANSPVNTDTPEPQIDLQVGSYSFYTDSIGSLWFVGEITNQGNVAAEGVEVALSLLDSGGNVVGVGSDSISIVQANGKFPFRTWIDNAPTEWNDVKIQIQGRPSDGQSIFPPYTELKVDKVVGNNSAFGRYTVTGIVINTGQKTATLVHVVAVAYDESGKAIDYGDTFTTLTDIAPGGDSPFSLDFGHIENAPASYELFVVSFSQ